MNIAIAPPSSSSSFSLPFPARPFKSRSPDSPLSKCDLLSLRRRKRETRRFYLSGRRQEEEEEKGMSSSSSSPWDDKPFEILPTGRISYLDVQDIATFLDPPKELIPLDPSSYNPAAYLWKKIGDVPEERRHHLLYILKSRLISRMWEIAGMRYQDPKLAKQTASTLLSMGDSAITQEIWSCRTSKGPLPISWNWTNNFKKAIFQEKNEGTYGRLVLGGLSPAGLANLYGPLYFTVHQASEVMSTEQPCDLAYEFGDGLLDLHDFPEGFPKPVEHRWPFDDHLVIYVRHAGPGVVVGQAWQEGKDLEQVPKKFCGEILMVKDYS
ncbi:uncharacterized protein M6B38_276475 [Iris pallida]|uniref:Uncharacterized protein n=1 Tax=Iris pallida TaxID=29817 RepID=A0AAX6I5G2_IRIPA|nr:uncharacterized protein M6B38_276475 [Iris pallida]